VVRAFEVPSSYRPYIIFSTVANPRQTGEDTYSKFSASPATALKRLKKNDLE
jgi:hypothetical protein